jgi:hypothetical protein
MRTRLLLIALTCAGCATVPTASDRDDCFSLYGAATYYRHAGGLPALDCNCCDYYWEKAPLRKPKPNGTGTKPDKEEE